MTTLAAALQAQAAPLDVAIPELPNVTADATCGGRPALVSQAFCLSTTQAAVEGVVTNFSTAFEQQGWIAAGGRENVVVYVKRKPEGGCDAFQLIAYTDDQAVPAPAAPAYLALAAIPGDICRASGAETPTP